MCSSLATQHFIVMGCVLQFGKTAHKRIHHYYHHCPQQKSGSKFEIKLTGHFKTKTLDFKFLFMFILSPQPFWTEYV